MKIHTMVHLDRDDEIVAEIRVSASGRYLSINFPALTLFVYETRTPEHFARFCDLFELQEQTAPDADVEDGVVPAGNEPERMSA